MRIPVPVIDKQGSGRRREGSYDLTLRRTDPAAQCSPPLPLDVQKVRPPSSGQDWNRAQLTISEDVNVEELEKMAEKAHTTNGRPNKECLRSARNGSGEKDWTKHLLAWSAGRSKRGAKKMLVPVERERKRRGVAKQNRNKSRRRRSSTYTRLCPRKFRKT